MSDKLKEIIDRREKVIATIVSNIGHLSVRSIVNIVTSYVSIEEAERIAREIVKGK